MSIIDLGMKLIAVNDIKKPVRITVHSRNQLLQVLRGAHHVRDAMEIYFEGVGSIYYVCAMDNFNEEMRKTVLSRATGILQRNTPANFNAKLEGNRKIPEHIFKEMAV